MNVTRIEMSPAQATTKLRAVRRALKRGANAEYDALADAYAAAVEGKPLIQLSQAIRAAPRDAKGRPRLAVARADRRHVTVELYGPPGDKSCAFSTLARQGNQRLNPGNTNLVVEIYWPFPVGYMLGHGLVPIVPPDVLETAKVRSSRLREYHILFEVEQWSDTPLDARPDIDPYLLRHVTGDLWAVIAEWELTDIERAVMAARATD